MHVSLWNSTNFSGIQNVSGISGGSIEMGFPLYSCLHGHIQCGEMFFFFFKCSVCIPGSSQCM